MNIAILLTSCSKDNQLNKLAHQLNLKVVPKPEESKANFVLYYNDNNFLCLQKVGENSLSPIYVDFFSIQTNYRRISSNKKNEMIAKAVGLKKDFIPTILDTTAGLGQDAFVLATLGCSVHMLEQSPIIAALLEDGLVRAKEQPELRDIVKRMQLIVGNSIDYLNSISTVENPDVIYLDPMFPLRKKTALAKKTMQTLQALLENQQTDEKTLLNLALDHAKKRVVVKRHKTSASIDNRKPDIIFTGKSCHFDVYLK